MVPFTSTSLVALTGAKQGLTTVGRIYLSIPSFPLLDFFSAFLSLKNTCSSFDPQTWRTQMGKLRHRERYSAESGMVSVWEWAAEPGGKAVSPDSSSCAQTLEMDAISILAKKKSLHVLTLAHFILIFSLWRATDSPLLYSEFQSLAYLLHIWIPCACPSQDLFVLYI